MPALILAALQIAAVWIIQRLIVGFGIGFVTYKVSSYLTDWVVGQIRWGLGQIGGATAELISLMGFVECINIVLSAFSAALALKWAKKTLTFGLGL